MTVTLGLDPADPLTKRLRDAPARLSNVGPVVEALLLEAAAALEEASAREATMTRVGECLLEHIDQMKKIVEK